MRAEPVRAVFLDRDGVLNAALRDAEGRPRPPRSEAEFALLPDAAPACARLRAAGFLLVGVTNQPDIARGTTPRAWVEVLNARVRLSCGLDDLLMCDHDDAADCPCRKPRPGLLLRAARERGVDLARSWMVGDRWRDVECGRAAGCRTVLIDLGWEERGPAVPPDAVARSLGGAADLILAAPTTAQAAERPR